MSGRRIGLLLGVMVAVVVGVVGIFWWVTASRLSGPSIPNHVATGGSTIANSGSLQQLQADLNAMQDRLSSLDVEGMREGVKNDELQALREDLARIRLRAETIAIRESREGVLLELAGQAASQSLSAVSGMMTFMSILFTIVLFGVALITGLQVNEARKDVERLEIASKRQRTELSENGTRLQEKLAHVESRVEQYEKRLAAEALSFESEFREAHREVEEEVARIGILAQEVSAQRASAEAFLNSLIEVHASAVLDLLDGLVGHPSRSRSPRFQRLMNKGQELKGRLLLLHPDSDRRRSGVLLLSAVGTKISQVDLLRLLKKSETDKDMALLIRSAIDTIERREG